MLLLSTAQFGAFKRSHIADLQFSVSGHSECFAVFCFVQDLEVTPLALLGMKEWFVTTVVQVCFVSVISCAWISVELWLCNHVQRKSLCVDFETGIRLRCVVK